MRLFLPLSLLICSLSFTSCMDLNLQMNLKADGSAQASLQLEMLDQLFSNMRGMASAAGYDLSMLDEAGAETFFSDKRGRLESYSNTVDQGVRVIKMQVAATDGIAWLNAIAPQQMHVKPLPGQTDTYQLEILGGEISDAITSMDEAALEQYLASLRTMMTGFYAEMSFQFPEVVETNMQKVSAKRVAYTLDFDSDLVGLSGNEAVAEVKRLLGPQTATFTGVVKP